MALIKLPQAEERGPQLLVPTDAVWYPFHESIDSAVPGMPNLNFVTGHGGNFGAQGFYAFPAGNTTAAIYSGNSLTLDTVFSTVGMVAGNQWLIAHENTPPNHSGTGYLWCYGNDGGSWSHYGLAMISTERLQFFYRGIGASAQSSHSFAGMTAFQLGPRCRVVTSIEAQSATEILVRCLYASDGDATIYDTGYSALLDLTANSGTNPGRAGNANHAGLTIGARPTSGWAPAGQASIANYASLYGNGSGNGRTGNFQARKFAQFDSARQAAVLADLIAKPREFSATLAA